MTGFGIEAALQIVPLVLVAVILLVGFQRHRSARESQAQGVVWLQAMRLLITHIQRHRGLSSGVLCGEKELQSQLEEVQKQVSRDFDHISHVGDWVKNHEGWQGITQHWARLAGHVHKLTVVRNIDQHNRLIKNILVLVDEIASVHHLGYLSGTRANIWRELLTLAEYIGQARAIGTSVAASGGQQWSDDMGLKARKELQKINQEIIATLEIPRCRMGLDDNNLQGILEFLEFIDGQLLSEDPRINAHDFFAAATRTLDRLYERFDEELSQVSRRLVN